MRIGLLRSFSRIKRDGCCKCFKCLKCLGNGIGLVKCDSCGSLQPAPPTRAESSCCPDYYRLLLPGEVRPRFDVDLKRLREGYLALQAIVHPDRMGPSMGQSWTSWVNRAHATLKDPLQRAIYLLDRYKQETENENENENERDKRDASSTAADAAAAEEDEGVISHDNMHDISQVLEIREEISMTKDPIRLEALKRENDERIRKCCEELRQLLDCGGWERGGGFGAVKRCINQLRYWKSIEKELNDLM